jgi:hypothetical protein
MYKAPQISNEKCKELSDRTGLCISNREHKGVQYPVIKPSAGGKYFIDTAFNYLDVDYTNIIKGFKGDLLILGLGMGRGIIEACAKSKVKTVMVVEIDSRMIDLFWLIYGHDFKGVNKLSITEGDALEYNKTDYDQVFIDIFQPPFNKKEYALIMDGLRYKYKKIKINYIDLY